MTIGDGNLASFDLDAILEAIRTITAVVSKEWILQEKNRFASQVPPNPPRPFAYLSRPSPPSLIEWFLALDQWKEEVVASGHMVVSLPIIKLTLLGQSLKLTQELSNFQRVADDLRDSNKFHAAMFEAEVAASYVRRGYHVDFVEETDSKTPDLRVVTDAGQLFWVECKCRDMLSQQDRQMKSIWEALSRGLLQELRSKQLNYVIFIRSHIELRTEDIGPLHQFVLDCVHKSPEDQLATSTPSMYAAVDDTGHSEVFTQRICEADEEIEAEVIGVFNLQDFDEANFHCEARIGESGETYVRNPILLGFTTDMVSDRVNGISNSLRTAADQLPREEPGIIWIRIPDGHWKYQITDPWERTEALLKRSLHGDNNRRVNAVIVTTREAILAEQNGVQGLLYMLRRLEIAHDNPRNPLA